MDGVPAMTPFHRAVLNTIMSPKEGLVFGNDVSCAKLANEAWRRSVKGQQFLTNIANGGYTVFHDVGTLSDFFEKFNRKSYDSEMEYIDNGLVKLYDGEKWLVTCTTSYAASKKYYGDSHWCTASDIFGQYNGFNMFVKYTIKNDCFLLQFVNKADRTKSYQAAVRQTMNWAFSESFISLRNIYDFDDNRSDEISLSIALGDEKEAIFAAIDGTNGKLLEATRKMVREEEDYWRFKLHSFLEKNHEKGAQAMLSDDVAKLVIKEFKDEESVTTSISSFAVSKGRVGNSDIYVVFYSPPDNPDNQYFNNNITNILNVMKGSTDYWKDTQVTYIAKKGTDNLVLKGTHNTLNIEESADGLLLLGPMGSVTRIFDTNKCETVYSFDHPISGCPNYLSSSENDDTIYELFLSKDESILIKKGGRICTENGKIIYDVNA